MGSLPVRGKHLGAAVALQHPGDSERAIVPRLEEHLALDGELPCPFTGP